MMRVFLIAAICLLLPASAWGQAVQLPSFRQFSTSTTVVVPDRGSVSLGGLGRAAGGSSQFGVPGIPGSRSSSSATQASGVSVSAQIHDFAEMDRQLLEQAAAMRGKKLEGASRPRRGSTSQAVSSVAEIRRTHEAAQVADDQVARDLLQKAEDAFSAGKYGVATIYYRMAANRGQADVRALASAGLARCHASRQTYKK
jgi:hypothetical protein